MRTLVWLLLIAPFAVAEESLADVTAAVRQALEQDRVDDAVNALATMGPLYAKSEDEQDRTEAVRAAGKAAKSKDLGIRHGGFAALGAMRAKGSSKSSGAG